MKESNLKKMQELREKFLAMSKEEFANLLDTSNDNFSKRRLSNLDKLKYAKSFITPEAVKKAHDKVNWKKVNGAKDNKAIQRHRMQKIYAFKDGVLVGEYESQMEAGRRLAIPQGNIRSAIDNNKIRKGYTFRSSL